MFASSLQVAVATIAFTLLLGLLPASARGAPTLDRIVAVVNNEVITLSELEEEMVEVKDQARRRFNGPELDRRLRQIEYMGLNRMIERKLQIQIAKKRGIKVTDDEVKDAINRLRRLGEMPNESDPKEMATIKEQLTAMRLVNQQVRSGLIVSEEEMLRFYKQHQDRFVLPPEARISQILVALGPSSSLLRIHEKAQEIYALLKKGERFEEVAARHSDGAEARRGGSLGFVRLGDILPQIQRIIESVPIGQYSEPVASPMGMHIIRVDERKPPQFRPYEEVKEDLRNVVFQLKSEQAYLEWIKDLRDRSYIEVRL